MRYGAANLVLIPIRQVPPHTSQWSAKEVMTPSLGLPTTSIERANDLLPPTRSVPAQTNGATQKLTPNVPLPHKPRNCHTRFDTHPRYAIALLGTTP